MAFTNDSEFQDDFRKVGEDVTAGFEQPGDPSNPTEHAGSENLDVAAKADDLDEEDEDIEDDEEEDEDDIEDDDLEEEDDDADDLEDTDDDEELEDDEEEEDDSDEEDDELEEDDDTVKARAGDALKTARVK